MGEEEVEEGESKHNGFCSVLFFLREEEQC